MLNIDSDVIVKKNWLQKLKSTYYTSRYTTHSKLSLHVLTMILVHVSTKLVKALNTFHHKKSIGGD